MKNILTMTMLATLAAIPVRAQERTSIPFRNPSMPRQLVVDAILGSIEVTGYNGQEVIIESSRDGNAARAPRGRERTPVPPGMRRIGGSDAGLDVTEDNNIVRISSGWFAAPVDIKVQVPVQTSVRVTAVAGRHVQIENVNGEVEVQNANGEVNITNVSGSVVANSMNGKVTVSLNGVAADKPMSFSTMNGDIDVTLPANTKANLMMKTNSGDIFTDFDVQINTAARATTGNTKGKSFPNTFPGIGNGIGTGIGNGHWVIGGQGTAGTINGGGPEIQFTSFRGNILIHKK